jgi:uncharacterized protein YbaA (DUF1428 family)
MSNYIDGFVIPLRKDKIEDYRVIAEKAGAIWREYGALDFYECIGDDLEVKDMVSFPQLASAGPDETVVFSWIVYQSREHRDEVNAKVMADPRLADMMDPANSPFDCKRMAYGGFKELVHA